MICLKCGVPHGGHGSVSGSAWEESLPGFARGLSPSSADGYVQLGYEPLVRLAVGEKDGDPNTMGRKRDPFYGPFLGYVTWCDQQALTPRTKGTALYVCNPSIGPKRKEHNFDGMTRVYFDCDEAGTWDKLVAHLESLDTKAYLSESSSSVARDPGGINPVVRWHVEFPYSQEIRLSKNTDADSRDGFGPEWVHEKNEHKRAYQYMAAYFSAKAGFAGVGLYGKNHCGFDLSTNQLCIPRFVPSRAVEGGRLPRRISLNGSRTLDYYAFLRSIGFEFRPYVAPAAVAPKTRTVLYHSPSGKVVERQLVTDGGTLPYVKSCVSVNALLERIDATPSPNGAGWWFCPMPAHNERVNPDGLSDGPNTRGFHVFIGAGGFEHWRCQGNCQGNAAVSSGDVFKLGIAFWGLPYPPNSSDPAKNAENKATRGRSTYEAAKRIADMFGLDMQQFAPKAKKPKRPKTAPEGDESDAAQAKSDLAPTPVLSPEEVVSLILDSDERGTYYDMVEPPEPGTPGGPPRQANPIGEPRRKRRSAGARRRRMKTDVEGGPYWRLADWLEDHVAGRTDMPAPARRDLVRAACGTLLGLGVTRQRGVKNEFVPRFDPERLAATIDTVLWDDFDRDAAFGMTLGTFERLQTGQPVVGRKRLHETAGPVAALALAGAVWREEQESGTSEGRDYMAAAAPIVGHDRVTGRGRGFLYTLAERVRKQAPVLPPAAPLPPLVEVPPKPPSQPPGAEDPAVFSDEQLAAWSEGMARHFSAHRANEARAKAIKVREELEAKHEIDKKRNEWLAQHVLRATCCGRFVFHTETTYGRDLGYAIRSCKSKACMFCAMSEINQEWDLALALWKKAAGDGGAIYASEVTLETPQQVDTLRKLLTKYGGSRLAVTSFHDRDPIYVCYMIDERAQSSVYAAMDHWTSQTWRENLQGLTPEARAERELIKDEWFAARSLRKYRLASVEEALGLCMERKIGYHAELAQRIQEEDDTLVKDFMSWAFRRQTVVARSPSGLPWPTQEMVKEARKAKSPEVVLEEGEEKIITAIHRPTGIPLVKTMKIPPTFDQCMAASMANPNVRRANAEILRGEREAWVQPARAPASAAA